MAVDDLLDTPVPTTVFHDTLNGDGLGEDEAATLLPRYNPYARGEGGNSAEEQLVTYVKWVVMVNLVIVRAFLSSLAWRAEGM